MEVRRIAAVNDLSGFGRCSLTVSIPILSAMGFQVCPLPTAVLSAHTGYPNPVVRDFTDDMEKFLHHWESLGLTFACGYTGYLGNERQADVLEPFLRRLREQGAMRLVDPAMADHGKLYSGFNMDYAHAMAQLCTKADVILPNLTESCLMTGCEYRENYDEAYIAQVLSELHAMGMKTVVLTGVSYCPEETGVLISDGKTTHYYRHQKLSRSYHGTGDIYASAFVGSWLGGKTMEEAAQIAADYACECIRATIGDENHWYGTKFESMLYKLIEALK